MPNYDVLIEAVEIGAVTAKNSFYQVPHCYGMGHLRSQVHAALRGMKALGGWTLEVTTRAIQAGNTEPQFIMY